MKLKLILAVLVATILLTGCGGSSDSSTTTATQCEYSSITVGSASGDAVIQTELDSNSNCIGIKLTVGTADITLDGTTEAMVLNQIYTVDAN